MNALKKKCVSAAAAALLVTSGAASAQSIGLFQGGGILNFTSVINEFTKEVTIQETWRSSAPAILRFSGFTGEWSVRKSISNGTGSTWTRFATELLDPLGPVNDDGLDPLPYPSFVPAGWSTSNDGDGLSFGNPRNSPQFASLFIDELTDARDFMDFFNGSIANGDSGVLSFKVFGLVSGEDFLLVQRPNEFSSVIPVPGALPLLASGLLAFGWMSRRRKA